MKPQLNRILKYLETHKGITDREARNELGIARLSGRMFEFRQLGYETPSIWETEPDRYGGTSRFKRYFVHEKHNAE